MKKIIPAFLILLFASTAVADIVYLNNGQSFRADLLRITPREIYVTIGGLTEIDFEKTTIDRVEDDEGNILYDGKKVIVADSPEPEISRAEVPDPGEQASLESVVADPEEPVSQEVVVPDFEEPIPMEVVVADPVRPEPIEFEFPDPEESGPIEFEFPEPEGEGSVEAPVPDADTETEYSGEIAGYIESEPSEAAYREPDSPDEGETRFAYTPPPPSVRSYRFYTRALNQGSIAVGGLVSFSSVGGDINEGAYGIPNDERRYLFAVAPSVTYFLDDNIGIGGDIMYNREWLTNRFEDQLSLGPRFVYAFPLDKEFRPYASAGIGIMQWRFNENDRAYSRIGMTVKAGPGLFYFVNENYAVNMELIYKWDRFGTDLEVYPITGNTVLFSIGLSGFIY